MSNRSGAAGYKGNIPSQFFVSFPGALNIDEINKPQESVLYPSSDNQALVLGLTTPNVYGRNQPFQRAVTVTADGQRNQYHYLGISGQAFTNVGYGGALATCPYGGGVGVTKHRVNIDLGQSVTLNQAFVIATSDFFGPSPGVFGHTTSLTSTTGTNLYSVTLGNASVLITFSPVTSRYWFLECNFPGAGCGGCGSSFYLTGVRTSDNIWLPLRAIPYVASKAYKEPFDNFPYYIVNGDSSTISPDPWVTRQTTSTIYKATRSPGGIDLNGNGVIQISGIATDNGRPYVGQTISGTSSSATGRVLYTDTSSFYGYGDIASGVAESATIIYEPTSIASFSAGEKIYSIASSKPEPKLTSSPNTFTSSSVLKVGSGLINGSGSVLATIINNNNWYMNTSNSLYIAVSGTPSSTSNFLGYFDTNPTSTFLSNNQTLFYSASGTILCSGILYQNILFNTGSGYLDIDYQFTGAFEGSTLNTASVISPGSGGWT